LIFIVGPTAIGKSEFAIKLAQHLKGEIINADSMQVYSELKILTARPSSKDQSIIPHHLYGHINGAERYNVADWCKDTIPIIKKNNEKKIYSIFVGGTGLYVEKLLNGLANLPKVSEKYKKQSQMALLNLGLEEFYNKIYKIDKISCKKISKNDSQRMRRIWEVYYCTGIPLSKWIGDKHQIFLKDINYNIFLFTPNRQDIYERVDKRFLEMINMGAIKEVKNLLSLHLDTSLPIMKAHGVPEISKYLAESMNLQECITKAQQFTRNYVKRQLTWWKSTKLNIHTVFEEFPSNTDLKLLNF